MVKNQIATEKMKREREAIEKKNTASSIKIPSQNQLKNSFIDKKSEKRMNQAWLRWNYIKKIL